MRQSKKMALGGIFAALAIVVMSLGGMIPVATFVCPMICIILLHILIKICGSRIGWAWYAAVALLSALLSPDKEAAAVFLFLGYYPIIKPRLDRCPAAPVLKLALFNMAIGIMYFLLTRLIGLDTLTAEYEGLVGVLLVILGNVTFYLLDLVLSRLRFK